MIHWPKRCSCLRWFRAPQLLGALVMVSSGACSPNEPEIEGPEPPVSEIIHAAPATETQMSSIPCGDRTLATLEVVQGHFVFFCDLEDGIAVGETAPLHHEEGVIEGVFDCPLDIFLAFAPPDAPIPARLREDCNARLRRSDRPIALDLKSKLPGRRSHYCSGAGALNFQEERCLPGVAGGRVWHCDGGFYRTTCWCLSNLMGWHQKSSNGQFNSEADHGVDIIASCGGSTRFRGWWDGDLIFDNTVLANYWQSVALMTGDDECCLPDHEIRFRGDSYEGASHRASGSLEDWNWP